MRVIQIYIWQFDSDLESDPDSADSDPLTDSDTYPANGLGFGSG